MSGRRLARPGLSYIEANSGRLITETAELLDMKAQIRERWSDLDIYFDDQERVFIVTQKGRDGIERLVLSRSYCNDRLLEDISKTDPTSRNYIDPIEAVDEHNARIERERDRELEEIAGDVGERLKFAFKQDGLYDHEDIGVKPKPQRIRDRAIR